MCALNNCAIRYQIRPFKLKKAFFHISVNIQTISYIAESSVYNDFNTTPNTRIIASEYFVILSYDFKRKWLDLTFTLNAEIFQIPLQILCYFLFQILISISEFRFFSLHLPGI